MVDSNAQSVFICDQYTLRLELASAVVINTTTLSVEDLQDKESCMLETVLLLSFFLHSRADGHPFTGSRWRMHLKTATNLVLHPARTVGWLLHACTLLRPYYSGFLWLRAICMIWTGMANVNDVHGLNSAVSIVLKSPELRYFPSSRWCWGARRKSQMGRLQAAYQV